MSERSSILSKILTNKRTRLSYIKSKLGIVVPSQIRALRLKSDMPRQADLAREAEMHQSRISMLETPGVSNVTLDTLAWLAATFGVGLIVKFVSFSEMLKWEKDFAPESFDVLRLQKDSRFLTLADRPSDFFATQIVEPDSIIGSIQKPHTQKLQTHAADAALAKGSVPRLSNMEGYDLSNIGWQKQESANAALATS